jgi:uncharacterized protein YicC (UPF0701 family)
MMRKCKASKITNRTLKQIIEKQKAIIAQAEIKAKEKGDVYLAEIERLEKQLKEAKKILTDEKEVGQNAIR